MMGHVVLTRAWPISMPKMKLAPAPADAAPRLTLHTKYRSDSCFPQQCSQPSPQEPCTCRLNTDHLLGFAVAMQKVEANSLSSAHSAYIEACPYIVRVECCATSRPALTAAMLPATAAVLYAAAVCLGSVPAAYSCTTNGSQTSVCVLQNDCQQQHQSLYISCSRVLRPGIYTAIFLSASDSAGR